MGYKAATCTICGVTGMMGCLFYLTCAIMVMRENQVFLEHKAGVNTFTVTQKELEWKFHRIAMASLVSSK